MLHYHLKKTLLAETINTISSSVNYDPKFQKFQNLQGKKSLNFHSDNAKDYNEAFSLKELSDALIKAHDTETGQDYIYIQLLKHLPESF